MKTLLMIMHGTISAQATRDKEAHQFRARLLQIALLLPPSTLQGTWAAMSVAQTLKLTCQDFVPWSGKIFAPAQQDGSINVGEIEGNIMETTAKLSLKPCGQDALHQLQ